MPKTSAPPVLPTLNENQKRLLRFLARRVEIPERLQLFVIILIYLDSKVPRTEVLVAKFYEQLKLNISATDVNTIKERIVSVNKKEYWGEVENITDDWIQKCHLWIRGLDTESSGDMRKECLYGFVTEESTIWFMIRDVFKGELNVEPLDSGDLKR